MRLRWGLATVLAATGCLDLSIPSAPGPGSVQGTVVFFRPGRSSPLPASGAKVSMVKSSIAATANADGLFRLEPIDSSTGTLVITLDFDSDGRVDRQRSLELASLGAGRGRQVALGQVTLGLNATISGKVLRSDLGSMRGGHGGTAIVVPEGPYVTSTADDGSFLLRDLPDGPVRVAFVRDGYDVVVQDVALRSGEERTLEDTQLVRTAGVAALGALTGRIVTSDGSPLEGATVRLGIGGTERSSSTTRADGTFRFPMLSPGIFELGASKDGFSTLTVRNIVVAGDTHLGDLMLGPGTSTPPQFFPFDAGTAGGGAGGGNMGGGAAGGGVAGGGVAGGGVAGGGVAGGGVAGGGVAGGGVAGGGVAGGTAGDAGLLPDGGSPLPVAVISQPLLSIALDPFLDGGVVDFFVDGDRSTGSAPFEYRWDTLSPPLLEQPVPNISFSSRARFTFSRDAGVGRYRFRLFVRDALGRLSFEATAEARAAYRPVPSLTPAQVTAGSSTTLSSAGSFDRAGLPLVSRFFLVSGQATLAPAATSVTVNALMPGAVVVGCEVENTFGLKSDLVYSTITFVAPPGTIAVDAGPPQMVDGGTLVRLHGHALINGPASVVWSLAAPPQEPQFSIVPEPGDPFRASFTAPFVKGGDQARQIHLEVRTPPFCMGSPPGCLVGGADTTVLIRDREGPQPTVILGGPSLSSIRSILIDFDEPPASPVSFINGLTLERAGGGGTFLSRVVNQESPTRFRVIPQSAFVPGFSYLLGSPVTHDATPAQNQGPAINQTFLVRAPVATSSQSSSAVLVTGGPFPPAPGVAVLPAAPPRPSQLLVAGWRGGVDQGFAFDPQPTASATLNGQAPYFLNGLNNLPPHDGAYHRMTVRAGVAYAQLAVANLGGGSFVDGAIVAHQGMGTGMMSWTRLATVSRPESPGPIGADSTALYALVATPVSYGLIRYNAPGWPDYVMSPGALEPVFPALPGALNGQLFGAISTGGSSRSVVVVTPSNQLTVARFVNAGPWESQTTNLGSASKAIRIAHAGSGNGQKTFIGNMLSVASFNTLRIDTYSGGTVFAADAPPAIAGSISGFDLVRSEAGEHVVLAVAHAGGVNVYRRATALTGWEFIASFGTAGCAFVNPELAVTEDEGLFVTWAQSCGGMGWVAGLGRID